MSKISRETARSAGRAISAARDRGALSDERAAVWAEQVLTAGSDETAQETIAWINQLHGSHGPGPGLQAAEEESEYDDLVSVLYPGDPQRRAGAAQRLAASAPAEDDEDFSHLFRPGTPEQADRQRIAAARRPQPVRHEDDGWDDEELHAAIFGDSAYTGPGSRPHVPHVGQR
jgi:hypothetical protein